MAKNQQDRLNIKDSKMFFLLPVSSETPRRAEGLEGGTYAYGPFPNRQVAEAAASKYFSRGKDCDYCLISETVAVAENNIPPAKITPIK